MTDNHLYINLLLRAADPVDEESLPLPSESPMARRLYEQITGSPYEACVVANNVAHVSEAP